MHGGDIYSFERETGKMPLDFSENTNPYKLPVGVKQAIIDNVDVFQAYPDPMCRELTHVVAKYYDVREEELLFGNGAADIIFRIAYALKPANALILAPTFSEYELSLKNVGTQIHYFQLEESIGFAVTEDILKTIPGKDIVYICNPNNPTGRVCERKILCKIAEECRKQGAYLVVDECFMDFVEEGPRYSLIKEMENFRNLIILKAFTKTFAMAGLRLGFCLSSNQDLLEKIRCVGQPWSVSTVAQVAGIACCDEAEYIEESMKEIQVEKVYLMDRLQELGLKTYESNANYILFQCTIDLAERLKKYEIMIRSCGNYIGLNGDFYRIAVKRHLENEALISALQDIKKEEMK